MPASGALVALASLRADLRCKAGGNCFSHYSLSLDGRPIPDSAHYAFAGAGEESVAWITLAAVAGEVGAGEHTLTLVQSPLDANTQQSGLSQSSLSGVALGGAAP